MAETIHKADYQDAINIKNMAITVKGELFGFVTGLKIDTEAQEDLINVMGGTLRRRKPTTYNWSSDQVFLYNNAKNLERLLGETFQMVLTSENPDKSNSDNIGQTITLQGCNITSSSMDFNDSSTYSMSGSARGWTVEEK